MRIYPSGQRLNSGQTCFLIPEALYHHNETDSDVVNASEFSYTFIGFHAKVFRKALSEHTVCS